MNAFLKKSSAFLFLVIGASVLSAESFNIKETNVTTALGFESQYVSYGWKFADAVTTPKLIFDNGPWYLGIEGYVPVAKKSRNFNEWDYYLGYNMPITEKFSIDVGATVYNYPGGFPGTTGENETTLEQFIYFNYDTIFSPTFMIFHDYQFGSWIWHLKGKQSYELQDKFSLRIEPYTGIRDSNGIDKWAYVGSKLDLVYTVKENMDISLGVRGTENFDHSESGHGARLWWGTNCSYKF